MTFDPGLETGFAVFGSLGHFIPLGEKTFGDSQLKPKLSEPAAFMDRRAPTGLRNLGLEATCGKLAVDLARRACDAGKGFACFDVGGYIGRFGLPVAKDLRDAALAGQVHIYEPTPLFGLIERTTRVNGLQGEVQLHRKGVSSEVGMRGYHAEPRDLISGRLFPFPKSEFLYNVPTTTLDMEWEAAGRPEVVLAKIDTEGHEVHVLQGAQTMLAEAEVTLVLELWPWLRNEPIQGERYADWLRTRFEIMEICYAIRPREFTPVTDVDAFMDEVKARAAKAPTDILCKPRKG